MNLKTLFSLIFLLIINVVSGQLVTPQSVSVLQPNNTIYFESTEEWLLESFGDWDQTQEDLSLRDQNAKHFKNADGSYTAIIAAGNLHYWENNRWKTIFHSIVPSSNGFQNLSNNHKTNYPLLSSGSITTILPDGNTMKDMLGMRMFYETNGIELNSTNIQTKEGDVNFNELIYQNVYGSGIDLRLTQQTTKRKMDYLISNLSSLGTMPAGADYLVFEEKVELPNGWTFSLVENSVLILDAAGVVKAVYEKPMFKDAPQLDSDGHSHSDEAEGVYVVSQNGSFLTIQTKVQLDWLTDIERNFPVVIDPTINLYPNNTSWWTGQIDAYHSNSSTAADAPLYSASTFVDDFNDIIYVGRYSYNYSMHGWAKFNITSLPNSCVNSINLNYRVYDNFSGDISCGLMGRLRHLSNDPTITTGNTMLNDIRDGDIYEVRDFRTYTTGSGWVNAPLTANIDELENSIPSGWFGVGFHNFQGGPHMDCYTGIYGYSSSNRPYLTVNYTPHYQVQFSTPITTTFCAGQTQNVSVTVTNTGCLPWTSGWTLPNTVNFSWWGSWQAGGLAGGQDNNPRLTPFSALAPGASQTITFSVTAPSTPGTYSIQTDLVRDGVCWFRNNGTPDCGPGNVDYTFTITVADALNLTGTTTVSCGNTTDLNITGEVSTLPTGGTVTTNGYDRIHSFTATGAQSFVSTVTIPNSKVLVVAGGGGGGLRHAGGGGAGGLLYNSSFSIPSGSTAVNVGAGGAGITSGTGSTAVNNGQNSQFGGSMIAIGGGFGSSNGQAAGIGGSSGGGSNNLAGQPGTVGQGNKGGNQGCSPSTTVSGCGSGCGGCYAFGCGGGGAGAAAANHASQGSAGGVGLQYDITGVNTYYAGGGGGGRDGAANGYAGGSGGGGLGGGTSPLNGANGTVNTGGGGGGGGASGGSSGSGGNGGSGIVIVRYTVPVYSSSNTSVATVDPYSGVVTALSVGTTIISVTNGNCTEYATVTVTPGATAPTSVSATHPLHPNYCHGNTINLSSVGGTAAGGSIVDVWYENSCNTVVEETWSTTPVGRPGWWTGSTTVNSANGILNVTSTGVDPMIYMGNLSINPNVYRYIQVRYRYVSGPTNPGMQVFFENGSGLAESRSQRGTMIMDGTWHYLNLDMSVNYSGANSGWVGGGTVTGLRFDFCEASGMVMEYEFFLVSQDRMVGDQTTLTLAPSSPYYPTVSTQYFTRKIDNCGATSCASTNVNLPPLGTTLAFDNEAATCYVYANETIKYYHSSGRYIATVTAGASTLGSTIATTYLEPGYMLVPACNTPSIEIAVMQRHWVITPTTDGPATVRLPYYTSELADLGNGSLVSSSGTDLIVSPDNSNVLLSKYSGGAFPATTNVNDNPYDNCTVGGTTLYNNVGIGTTTPVPNIASMYSDYSIPGFSEFWLHGSNELSPLPITLSSFAAICDDSGDEVKVQWTTSSESNTSHFNVERSTDGTNWEVLGTTTAAGNSMNSLTYEMSDSDVRAYDVIYYRLKQVDLNGQSKAFGPVSAQCISDDNGFVIFPNPAGNNVTILMNGEFIEENTYFSFWDVNGMVVKTVNYSKESGKLISVDLNDLEPGVYFVQMYDGQQTNKFVKFVKQ